MKLLNNIKYFLFIGFNWNWAIALYLLKDNAYGQKKYQLDTTGYDNLKSLAKKGIDISHSTIYMPVAYGFLEKLFNHINLSTYHHLLDIGCGKGRALCVAAHYGVKKITGVDFYNELCRAAEENLEETKKLFPDIQYSILHADARDLLVPNDADCIFVFNPFNEVIMETVVRNIMQSLAQYPRKLTVIYVNPLHKELFLKEGFEEIYYERKMKYLEACIMKISC